MTREETIQAIKVMQAYVDGAEIESRDAHVPEWKLHHAPSWAWCFVEYRVKQTKPSIDWSHVADEFICMAKDSGGVCWLFDRRPTQCEEYWFDKNGKFLEAHVYASFKPGNCDWHDSLVWRPGHEPKGK